MIQDAPWQYFRSFLAVARLGSLSAAARSLHLTQPTLGRHIAELEAALDLALFTRSSAGLAPTEAAEGLLPMAEAMQSAAAALQRAAESANPSAGTVRIACSEIMGAEVLPAILAGIQRDFPAMIFELALSNRSENLLRRDADIAVRMFRPTQDAVLAQYLGEVSIGLYAHRDYLARHGRPETLAALRSRHLIGFDRDDASVKSLSVIGLDLDRSLFRVRTDSDPAQIAAIKAGLGIGGMQCLVAAKYPELLSVLPDQVRFRLPVWLAMHEDQRGNRAVRAVHAGLQAGLAAWIGGQA